MREVSSRTIRSNEHIESIDPLKCDVVSLLTKAMRRLGTFRHVIESIDVIWRLRVFVLLHDTKWRSNFGRCCLLGVSEHCRKA